MLSCAVSTCSNNETNIDVSFFQFPKDKTLCQKWLTACELVDKINAKSAVVCEKHFENHQILGRLKNRLHGTKQKLFLVEGSIPTLGLSLPSSQPAVTDVPEKPWNMLNQKQMKRKCGETKLTNILPEKKPKIEDSSKNSLVEVREMEHHVPRIELRPVKCAAQSCKDAKQPIKSVSYYTLPTFDTGRYLIWLLNAGRTDLLGQPAAALTGCVLCEKHFESCQLVQEGPDSGNLLRNAVPTLFSSTPPIFPLHLVNPSQTDEDTFKPCSVYKDSVKPSSISVESARCYSCSKSYKTCPRIMLYFFPVDDDSRYYSWILNSGQFQLLQRPKQWVHQNCLLCSEHFEESQFEDTKRRLLRAGAVPTLFQGQEKMVVPAPTTFDESCRKPLPLLIKSSATLPERRTPQVCIVTLSSAGGQQSNLNKTDDAKGEVGSLAAKGQSSPIKGQRLPGGVIKLLNGGLLVPNSLIHNVPTTSNQAAESPSKAQNVPTPTVRGPGRPPGSPLPKAGSVAAVHCPVMQDTASAPAGPVIVSTSVKSLATADDAASSKTPILVASASGSKVPSATGSSSERQTVPALRSAVKGDGPPKTIVNYSGLKKSNKSTRICPAPSSVHPSTKTTTTTPLTATKTRARNLLPQFAPGSEKEPTVCQRTCCIAWKNTEPATQNTNAAKLVLQGNGPLSLAQLETVVKEGLLRSGALKDGVKISVQRKNGGNKDKNTEVESETLVVKEDKIVPWTSCSKQKGSSKNATKNKSVGEISQDKDTPNTNSSLEQLLESFSVNRNVPLVGSTRTVSTNLVCQLRKTIKMQKRKISRLVKANQHLKKARGEKIRQLSTDQLCKMVKEHLPGFSGTFFQSQLMSAAKDNMKSQYRWDNDTKLFALGMWNRGPAGFKLMKRAFNMPSIKTLSNWVNNVPPELNFFQKLEQVLSSPTNDPESLIREGEDLKEPGDANDDDQDDIDLDQCDDDRLHYDHNYGHYCYGGSTVMDAEELAVARETSGETSTEFGEEPLEPEGPHQEPLFSEEEIWNDVRGETVDGSNERAVVEGVCLDLDGEMNMQVVEEIVNSSDVSVEQFITNGSDGMSLPT